MLNNNFFNIDDRLLEMDYGRFEGADLTDPPEEVLKIHAPSALQAVILLRSITVQRFFLLL